MTEKNDWTDLFPEAEKAKAEQKEKGFVFAQQYLVFEQEPRAKALLEHWTGLVRKRRIPANAGVGEYAAANGLREFIEAIYAQIEIAHNRANQP